MSRSPDILQGDAGEGLKEAGIERFRIPITHMRRGGKLRALGHVARTPLVQTPATAESAFGHNPEMAGTVGDPLVDTGPTPFDPDALHIRI